MDWIFLDLALTITFEGSLHIGTGYDRGLIDRTVVRDGRGNVYIPGSTLKGKVRSACEALAKRAELEVCSAPLPQTMCAGGDAAQQCIVCRVFGSPGQSLADGSGLCWHDARLLERWRLEPAIQGHSRGWLMSQATTRTQVQLSRKRGLAVEGRLYTSEFTVPGLEFGGRVIGWLQATPCTADIGYYEVYLLLAGLRLVSMLGGAGTRGAGRCQIALPEQITIAVRGQAQPQTHGADELLRAAECLGLYTEEEGGDHGRA